ncbi:hypothetical protein M9H77_02030 [Catharanthus roseus]|uniref:Uncharacterized protein n=1 Tax=Catharanthus roseus TaxID=4058 RepID=A0ACC0C7Q6_CATRO|nr:hypothetical protein M9H77_02030 [Catharanthus roseus]
MVKESLLSCLQCAQLSRSSEKNNLGWKLAKCLKEFTIPLMARLPLPSSVDFWMEALMKTAPIVDGSSYPTINDLIMSMDDHIPTQFYQEGTSEFSMRHVNEILRSLQQSIQELARQYQNVARDVEELKKDKSSATMEQRVGDNLGGFNSPHHKRPFENVSNYGYHDMPVQNSHPFMKMDIKKDHKLEVAKEGIKLLIKSSGSSRDPRTKFGSRKRDHRNQVPASRSRYQPNAIRAVDYKTTALPYHWSKQATNSWGTYQVYPGANLSFKPLLTLHQPRTVQSGNASVHLIFTKTLTLVGMRFSHVFTNRKAICPAIRTNSSDKHYRVVKILIRQSSHAYANFTIMPMPDLYSCLSKHVTSQAKTFSNV